MCVGGVKTKIPCAICAEGRYREVCVRVRGEEYVLDEIDAGFLS